MSESSSSLTAAALPSRPLAYGALALSMTLVGCYVALSKPLVAVFPVFLLAWLRFGIGGVAMVGWLLDNRDERVPGIGIDYRENDRPPELFIEAYRLAREAGLRTTAHAGEFGMPWTNVRTAVEQLHVDRIDHGYTVVDAPAFARECAERGLVFTVVPTNSYYLRTLARDRWALDHPIRRMPGLGLKIHPNTDDPTLHQVTPTEAWMMMVRDFGFGPADLRGFISNGLEAAWIDDSDRRRWQAQWLAAFDAGLADAGPWPIDTTAPDHAPD